LTFADAIFKPPTWLRALLLAVVWRMGVRLFLLRQTPDTISPSSLEMWIDLSTLITVVWWMAFEHMAELWSGVTVPLLLAALSMASAIVLMMGWHIQSSGGLAGAMVGICVAAAVLAAFNGKLFFGRISFTHGFAQMVVILLHLVLMHGYFYTDDTLTNQQQVLAVLLVVSPLLAFLGQIPGIRQKRFWSMAVRLGPVLVILGVIGVMTVRDYVHAEQSSVAGEE